MAISFTKFVGWFGIRSVPMTWHASSKAGIVFLRYGLVLVKKGVEFNPAIAPNFIAPLNLDLTILAMRLNPLIQINFLLCFPKHWAHNKKL